MTSAKINPAIQQRAVPIGQPVLFGKNPKRGDVDRIAKSLMENGQYKTIILRKDTNEVLAGNHTLKAARQLGWNEIAVEYVEVMNDEHAAQIVLVDNASADWGDYDLTVRSELLASLSDPSYGTGFEGAELEAALNDVVQEPAEVPDGAEDAPPAPEKPKTRLGDVWTLGPHRLVCGDATDPRVLEELLGYERPHLMWTDPPYGVEYEGKTKDKLRIQNDGAGELRELLDGAFQAAADVLRPGAPVYVAHADTERMTFESALREAGFLVRQNLIWVKNTMVLGHSDYHYKHEPILLAEQPQFNDGTEPVAPPEDNGPERPAHFLDSKQIPGMVNLGGGYFANEKQYKADLEEAAKVKGHEPILYGFAPAGTGRLGRGGARWYGPNNGTTVFEFPKPPSSVEHPTMKPVALILAQLANSLRQNQGKIILDPFAGSGSTMMAAELHGAHARLVELDPRYCDVIAMRWQKHTGEKPLRNGKPAGFPVKKTED